ncbi:MAG: DegV family protein [Eggerthellaceae bacterium]|nr:DegV family protein [Eggerthellaceae bacterium]
MEPRCNLIIDSCCDLPFDVVDRPGVDLIKFPYIQNGVEKIDDLYQSTTPKEFYDLMRDKKAQPPTTSQIPLQTLEDTFRRALESKVPTVYIAFTSGLSGSFDMSEMVATNLAQEYPEGQLYLVDSQLASIAEGLLVYEAIAQREKGLSAQEMVAWVEEARYFVNSQFMVDDLDSLRRGGRIPANVAKAGAKLDVKPLMTFDLSGKLTLSGVARGRKKGIRQLQECYLKRYDPMQTTRQVVVAHADCPKDAQRLCEILEREDPGVLILESNIGPVIGSHVGPGMIAIVFWGPDRREDISVADRIARRVKRGEA